MPRRKPGEIPPTPYTVVIDTREQRPYDFARPLKYTATRSFRVQTTVGTVRQGDYSLAGFEDRVGVERKSLQDLFGTLGQGRERFVAELERLSALDLAVVVVEAEWSQILTAPPARSQLNPKSVFGSILAWQQQFRTVHWMMVPGRAMGEVAVIKHLDRWWRHENAARNDDEASAEPCQDAAPDLVAREL